MFPSLTDTVKVGTTAKFSWFLIPAITVYIPSLSKNPVYSWSGMYTPLSASTEFEKATLSKITENIRVIITFTTIFFSN